MADTYLKTCTICGVEFDSIPCIDNCVCDECQEKERVSSQLIIDLRTTTAILSIKDMALVLGAVYDDIELSSLIDEIKKIGIIE